MIGGGRGSVTGRSYRRSRASRLRRHPRTRAAGATAAHRVARHDVVAVLTRPDAAVGRPQAGAIAGRPAKRRAGIPVLTPGAAQFPEFVAELAELAPQCCAVVAYGALLGDELLAIPAHGWINLHFSLLPAWRGAAPVQAAIAAGDTVTGASTFHIEPSLDSGPVYGVVTETIRPDDTAGELLAAACPYPARRCSSRHWTASPTARWCRRRSPPDGVSIAPKITVDDAHVRWELPAQVVERRIRSVTPNPGAWTLIDGLRLKIGPVHVDGDAEVAAARAYSRRPRRRAGRNRLGTGTCWARSSRRARNRCPPSTGPAVPASTSQRGRRDQADRRAGQRTRGPPASQAI